VTANIDNCDGSWQVGNNFINQTPDNVTYREGRNSQFFALTAAWTSTGLVAYRTLPATTDFSAYQQISFWWRRAAAASAGYMQLKLCSDQYGVTAVNTINIPANVGTNVWQPVTVDTGAALGSNIRSVALYVTTKVSTTESYWIDNIIACKAPSAADSLTLNSLIGKNISGETFYAISFINQNNVGIDNLGATSFATAIPSVETAIRGYSGDTEIIPTYKRETLKTTQVGVSTTIINTVGKTAFIGNPFIFSGGWDNATMSTQVGDTWLSGSNGNGYLFSFTAGMNNLTIDSISAVNYNIAISGSPLGLTLSNFTFSNLSGDGLSGVFANLVLSNGFIMNSSHGIYGSTTGAANYYFKNLVLNNNFSGTYLNYVAGRVIGERVIVRNSSQHGLQAEATRVTLSDCFTSDNGKSNTATYAGIYMTGSDDSCFINCVFLDQLPTLILISASAITPSINYISRYQQDPNYHLVDTTLGRIASEPGIFRHTQSGIAWKLSPNQYAGEYFPLILKAAVIAVKASSLVTVSAYLMKDSATMGFKLICRGGQIAGASDDVQSYLTTTGAYSSTSISFTPTEAGIVEIECHAWGGAINSYGYVSTANGWIDDITVTQS
jgi:hypothetical protein